MFKPELTSVDFVKEYADRCIDPVYKKYFYKEYKMTKEEIYQEAYVGLLKARKDYDANKSNGAVFETYAYRVIKNTLLSYIRDTYGLEGSKKRQWHREVASFNTFKTNTKEGDEILSLENILSNDDMSIDNIELRIVLTDYFKSIKNTRDKLIMLLFIQGKSQVDIYEYLLINNMRMSKSGIHKVIHKHLDILKRILTGRADRKIPMMVSK